MASVTNLGSASGLPLEDTLDKLQKVEDKKLSLYATRADSYQTRIDAYAKLQGGLESLQKSVKTLGKTETLAAIKGSVTGGNALTATLAAEGVTAGLYQIEITHLATTQSLKSNAVASTTKTEKNPATGKDEVTTTAGRALQHGDTGSFEITLGNGSTRVIDLKKDTSLNGIVKAINADDKSGLQATVINDGKGNDYLMLTAKDTGTEAAVKSITVTSGDASLKDLLGFDSAAATSAMHETKAADAALNINGIDITSGSNNVSKAIDGVTLNLTALTETDKPISLKLEADTSVASKAIQDFVKNYNALQTTIKELTAFDVNAHTRQPLTGDSTTRSLLSLMSHALQVEGNKVDTSVRSLGDLGIKTDPTTRLLKLDTEKLNKALAEHPADVSKLLAYPAKTKTPGDKDVESLSLSKSFDVVFKAVLGDNGSLKTRTDGLLKTKQSLEVQYKRAKATSDAEMNRMRVNFIALDKYVSQMSVTGNYLTQQFAALNKSTK